MHPFRAFIHNYEYLPEQVWHSIEPHLTVHNYDAEYPILKEGQICRHLYFLESGILRYFINNEGLEICKFFTQAPYCFTSQYSFLNQVRASENITSITPSVIWSLPRDIAFEFLKEPSWAAFIRKLTNEVQYLTEELLLASQSKTAEDRYKLMLTEESELITKVPMKYIASFLGIAPQSLSRIRKNVSLSHLLT